MNQVLFDYIRCPINKYTFQVRPVREWVEKECVGRTLNLFSGITKLNIDEVRNDQDPEALADYHEEALDLMEILINRNEKFGTVLLDPPYSYRKSMEFYKGIKMSPFARLKKFIPPVLNSSGRVITFGYQSNVMGSKKFYLHKIALFSHGGAIHDTIASVEVMI